MEKYGENYRGGEGPTKCPLCKSNPDSQDMSLECPIVEAKFKPKENIAEIYQDTRNSSLESN